MPNICCNGFPQRLPYSASAEADKRALTQTVYPPTGVAFEVRSLPSIHDQAGPFSVFHPSP